VSPLDTPSSPLFDLVASQAQSGTGHEERWQAALGLRLPQLCLPRGADQFLDGEAVAPPGAGMALWPRAATSAWIRLAVAGASGVG
jgi:hypothetical protein